MNEEEQASYLRLKEQRTAIRSEIVAVEKELLQATDDLATLIVDIFRSETTDIKWEHYQSLMSMLPGKIERLKQLRRAQSENLSQLLKFTEPL
jgi:hypothetical protein